MMSGFAALGMMPLGEFTAITFAAPLLITALSAPVLRERVGPHRWAAVVIGFIGVLVTIHPDPVHLVTLGALLALGQALGTAGAMLAIRQLGARPGRHHRLLLHPLRHPRRCGADTLRLDQARPSSFSCCW